VTGSDQGGPRSTRDHIEVPLGHARQQLVEAGALIPALGAGDALAGEDGGDGPALPLGDSL